MRRSGQIDSRFGISGSETVVEVLVSTVVCPYCGDMEPYLWRRVLGVCVCAAVLGTSASGAAKVHVISFGKWISVQWLASSNDATRILKVRPLLVDARMKEYVLGSAHEITDRLFVVRRVFRVNDSLPEDPSPRWQWQRGGWLMVDRATGKISAVNLPEFDPYYSAASWYRDYVAYCGVADDGKKVYAIVAQISRRKPALKKALSNEGVAEDAEPDSACAAPVWQRGPARVTFATAGAKETFAVRGHVVDVVSDEEEEEGSK
jgi:hypothetical protein